MQGVRLVVFQLCRNRGVVVCVAAARQVCGALWGHNLQHPRRRSGVNIRGGLIPVDQFAIMVNHNTNFVVAAGVMHCCRQDCWS